MFLFAFLLSLALFPHFSYSKQFLVELKSGKHKIIETNIGNNGNGDNGNGNGTDAQQKNGEGKNQSRPKPDHKKVENGNGDTSTEGHLTTMKTTSENRLTTTDKISQGEDYFLFEFVCFLFQFCPFGNPYLNPTEPTRPTFVEQKFQSNIKTKTKTYL